MSSLVCLVDDVPANQAMLKDCMTGHTIYVEPMNKARERLADRQYAVVIVHPANGQNDLAKTVLSAAKEKGIPSILIASTLFEGFSDKVWEADDALRNFCYTDFYDCIRHLIKA